LPIAFLTQNEGFIGRFPVSFSGKTKNIGRDLDEKRGLGKLLKGRYRASSLLLYSLKRDIAVF
jgi:hypothetical protein